jgi:ribonucleoside-diphosphate reductase alpha chain
VSDDRSNLEVLVDSQVEEIASLTEQLDEYKTRIEELEERIEELEDENDDLEEAVLEEQSPSSRRPPPHFKLPETRKGINHKFQIGQGDLGQGYLTVGLYPDSRDVGEIFIKIRKQSEEDIPEHLAQDPYVVRMHHQVSDLSTFLRGVLDQLAISVSIGLQRGIPLETYARKFRGTRFPPDGPTRDSRIPFARSIVDYIFRYLGMTFIGTEEWLPRDEQ